MTENDAEADAIAPEIMVRLIMHYKIGGYGKEFFSNYLNKRKSKFLDKKKKKWSGPTELSRRKFCSVQLKFQFKILLLEYSNNLT